MTTARKLWLGFGALTALLVLVCVAALWRVQAIEAAVHEQADVARPRSDAARQLEINVLGFALNVRAYLQSGDPKARQEAQEDARDVDRHLAEYEALASTVRQRQLAQRFAVLWQELKAHGQAQLEIKDRQSAADDLTKLRTLKIGIEKFLDDEMQLDAVQAFEASRDATFRDLRAVVGFILGLLVAGASVAVLTSIAFGRAVVRGERVIAEQAERLRTTLASIGDGVIATDPEGRITNLNAVAELLTGWTAVEAMGQPLDAVFRIVNEDTRQPVGNPVTRALQEGIVVALANHTILIAKDGTERFIDDSAAPIRCKDGEIVGCVLVFRDITLRKQAEEAHGLRHDRTHLLAQIAARLVLRGANGKRLGVDEMLQATFADVAQHLGVEYYFNYAVADDEPHALRLVSCSGVDAAQRVALRRIRFGEHLCGLVAKTRQPLVVEHLQTSGLENARALCAMGANAYAGFPLLADGRLIGTISFASTQRSQFTEDEQEFIQVVADLVAAAVDRDRLSLVVRDSEERFRTMADNIPQLAWMAQPGTQGQATWFNKAWRDYTGTTLEQNHGSGWHAVHHPDYAEAVIRKFEDHVAAGKDWEDTFPLRAKDGSFRWFLSRMKVIRDESGAPVRIFGTNTDITEQRETAEALQTLTAELSEADRRKDEFLATLAHELRNPLAPVRNAVQVLHMKGPDVPELQLARDIIDRQTRAMARLIDDLMDVSRINQGKVELKREKVELAKIVQGAIETSRPLIESMGHELTVTLPPGPVIVDADPTRLAQVFLNLLNNAAKYSERGGRIDLRATVQGSDVVVSVTDTGIGIAADKLPALFEMFSQVEGALSRSQGGLGVGLSLVKRLVEMHGGRVEAQSGGLGQGSEFVVRLPTIVERTFPRQTSDAGDQAQPTADLRILVVDDNLDAAESLAMLLKMMGNKVHTAHDGEAAVAAAEAFRPQVVLCDIGLPKLSGYEVCRRIREQAWAGKTILVAVTGWGQDGDKRQAQEAGFDHHMIKPVDPQALMKLLAGLDAVKA